MEPRHRIDADTHLYERRDTWVRHMDPSHRHLALEIVDDDLGHAWLTQGGRRVHLAEIHRPGDVTAMGAYRASVSRGEPAAIPFDDAVPRVFWDPEERVRHLSGFGLDAAVVFPNFGLLWERPLADRLEATLANMRAYNRHAAEVASVGGDRLYPVGHVSLRDVDWLESELASLSAAGVRLAMMAPALVDGKPLSHPDLDRAWSAFVDHGVVPVFHVSAFPRPFDDAWYSSDPDQDSPVLSSVFLWSAPALCLADMSLHGVFARHPELHVGVMELSSVWVGWFLVMLDGGFDFHARFNGLPITTLERRPSDYVRDHVRVAAFCHEGPRRLIRDVGEDMFMFSSDFPHAEGVARPVEDYERIAGAVEGRAGEQLYAGNLEWLLRLDGAA